MSYNCDSVSTKCQRIHNVRQYLAISLTLAALPLSHITVTSAKSGQKLHLVTQCKFQLNWFVVNSFPWISTHGLIIRVFRWCCKASTAPNSVGVWPDNHPNTLGKLWGNFLYITIQKHPVYADKLRAMQLKSEQFILIQFMSAWPNWCGPAKLNFQLI